jgi:CheY-like chemotaxis protein
LIVKLGLPILLVEDDVQLSKSLADRVSAAGYIVDCVLTGEEAAAAVAAIPYPLARCSKRADRMRLAAMGLVQR